MAFFRPFLADPFFTSPSSGLLSPSHSSLLFDDDRFFSASPLYIYDRPTAHRRGAGNARQPQQQLLKEQQASSEDNAQAMISGGDSGAAKTDKAAAPATAANPASPSAANKQTTVANNSDGNNSNSNHAVSSNLRGPRLLSPLSLLSQLSPASLLLSSRAVLPSMSVDMLSTEKEYTVHASVPGVAKQDLKVTVDDGVLTIEAERREETKQSRRTNSHGSSNKEQQPSARTSPRQLDKKEREEKAQPAGSSSDASSSAAQQSMDTEEADAPQYHHVESFYGHVSRSITLPDDCDTDGMTAKHEDGVLKINIPRLQEKKQRGTRLEIQ